MEVRLPKPPDWVTRPVKAMYEEMYTSTFSHSKGSRFVQWESFGDRKSAYNTKVPVRLCSESALHGYIHRIQYLLFSSQHLSGYQSRLHYITHAENCLFEPDKWGARHMAIGAQAAPLPLVQTELTRISHILDEFSEPRPPNIHDALCSIRTTIYGLEDTDILRFWKRIYEEFPTR